jgi:hypothetical protein
MGSVLSFRPDRNDSDQLRREPFRQSANRDVSQGAEVIPLADRRLRNSEKLK